MYYEEKRPLKERMAERDQEVLMVIQTLMKKTGRAPSIREIKRAAKFKSTSTTYDYLIRLRNRRKIEWIPNQARTIKIID